MPISLDEMAAFAEVIDSGSFSGAARKTGIPVSTISRRVADLEKRLGIQLLHRTTRHQRLTHIGETYYRHCRQMLNEAEAAELVIQNLKAEPSGLLRVTTPYVFEDPFSANMMQSFLEKYPKIEVDYIVTLRKIDLIEENFSCALVPGFLSDSSMRTRGLGKIDVIFCASPAYIERYGIPDEDNLDQHHLVNLTYADWMNIPQTEIESTLMHRLTTNEIHVARRSAVGGIGIARLAQMFVRRQLEEKTLVPVLPQFNESVPFSLVFPGDRQPTTNLRAFIDHVVEFSKQFAPWDFA